MAAVPPVEEPWSVESALAGLPTRPHPYSASSVLPFFHLLERLKTTNREGWVRLNLNFSETIGSHMYRMAVMTMFAPPSLSSRLNLPHCMKMALVHDMAESIVGDITPVDGVPRTEKIRRERASMDYLSHTLLGNVADGEEGRRLKEIWEEYEAGKSLEAIFVKDIDRMELICTAVEVEHTHEGKVDLGEFTWGAQHIVLPEVKQWCDELLEKRKRFWDSVTDKGGHQQEELSQNVKQRLEQQQDEYYGGPADGSSSLS